MQPINYEERKRASLQAIVFTLAPMLLFGLLVGLFFAGRSASCENSEEGRAAIELVELMTETRDSFEVMMKDWEDKFDTLKDEYTPEDDNLFIDLKNFESSVDKYLSDKQLLVSKGVPKNVAYSLITSFQKDLGDKKRRRENFIKLKKEDSEEMIDLDEGEEDYQAKYNDCLKRYSDYIANFNENQASLMKERRNSIEKTNQIGVLQRKLNECGQNGSAGIEHICIQKYDEAYEYLLAAFQKLLASIRADKRSHRRLEASIAAAEEGVRDAKRRVKVLD